MPNCPPQKIKKIKCPSNPPCNGTQSKLDRALVTGPIKTKSKLLYSNAPYECPPVTTCMVTGVDKLPNIPKEVYNVYNRTLFGIEPSDLLSNNFNKQCGLK